MKNWNLVSGVAFALSLTLLLGASSALAGEAEDFQRALKSFQEGNFTESREILKKLVVARPGSGLYWFNLANSQYSAKEYEAAVKSYDEVIRLGSKLAPAARLYSAQSYRQLGALPKAAEQLGVLKLGLLSGAFGRAFEEELGQLRADLLDRGLAQYRQGDGTGAIQSLELAVSLKNDADSAMMLGLVQMRIGKETSARESFYKTIATADDAETRQHAQELLEQLKNGGATSRSYWLWIDTAGGINSNAFAVGESVGKVSRGIVELQAGAGYRIVKADDVSFHIGYSFLNDRVFQEPSLEYFSHAIFAPVKYYYQNWLFQLTPQYKYETLGKLPYVSQISGGVLVEKSIGTILVGGSYLVAKSSGLDSYRYLTGTSQTRRIYFGIGSESYEFRAGYSDSRNNVGDFVTTTSTLPLGNTSRGPYASARVEVARWEFSARMGYYWVNYFAKAQPDNFYRNDKQFDVFGKVSFRLMDGLHAYISEDTIINKSNMGTTSTTNKNYTQNVAMLGFSWDVF